MMGIVINNPNAPLPAFGLKAPLRAGEDTEPFLGFVQCQAQAETDNHSRQRIGNIVPPRHLHRYSAKAIVMMEDIKTGFQPFRDNIPGGIVCGRINGVRNTGAI